MASYAVFWRNGGVAFHGRLEFDPHGLWLHGGERGHELRVEVPYDEIVSVECDGHDRIGPCQAIRVQTRAASDLLIASSNGASVLGEIQDTLCHATVGGHSGTLVQAKVRAGGPGRAPLRQLYRRTDSQSG